MYTKFKTERCDRQSVTDKVLQTKCDSQMWHSVPEKCTNICTYALANVQYIYGNLKISDQIFQNIKISNRETKLDRKRHINDKFKISANWKFSISSIMNGLSLKIQF